MSRKSNSSLIHNTVGICKQITSLIFYQSNSRAVTFLKFLCAFVRACDIFVLILCFKLINFVFQMFL
jgi:hypothetical protein